MRAGCNRDEAPSWFRWALSQSVEDGRVTVDNAGIEWLAWGEKGQPGVLLLAGNGANMGWWRPLAPFLAARRRVATFSWSGMGGSDWRDSYNPALFIQEAVAVAEAAGLYASGVPPVMVGHSFGGILTALAAANNEIDLRAAILVDARLHTRSVWGAEAPAMPARRIYATREEMLARFRLQPSQPERNRYFLDLISEEAIEGAEGGWRWRADPDIRRKTELGSNLTNLIARARCPLRFIRGAESTTVSEELWEEQRSLAPASTPFVTIPDAHHHVMVDQPIALIAALDALLQFDD